MIIDLVSNAVGFKEFFPRIIVNRSRSRRRSTYELMLVMLYILSIRLGLELDEPAVMLRGTRKTVRTCR